MLIYEPAGPDATEVLKTMAAAQVSLSNLLERTSTLSVIALSQGLRKES